MIYIFFSLLFLVIFGFLTAITVLDVRNSAEKYLDSYKNYLLNFGADFLEHYKKAKRQYAWKVFLCVLCSIETAIFLISLIYHINKFINQ